MTPDDLTRTVRTKISLCPDEGCDCWLWTGALDRSGYGSFKLKGKVRIIHRYVYEHFYGPIGSDLTVDHLCQGHRNCVNPEHFELVDRSTNSTRANARRWHGA